jgi:hypothetical protein
MVPIEEAGGRGIGHNLDTFITRFDEITAKHLRDKRALAFAFVFYDFSDSAARAILKDRGVFAKLDRLAGTKLSIFYMHQGSKRAVNAFNREFLAKLQVVDTVRLPAIVFFKVGEDRIYDIAVAELESLDLIHGLSELETVIVQYIQHETGGAGIAVRSFRWLKGAAQFIAIETFRAALKKTLEQVF